MRSKLLVSLAVVSMAATLLPLGSPAASSQEGRIPTELVADPRRVAAVSSAGVDYEDVGLRARLTRADTGEPLAGMAVWWFTSGPGLSVLCIVPFSCFGNISTTDSNGVAHRPNYLTDGNGSYRAVFDGGLGWDGNLYRESSAEGAALAIRIRVP